ncbi:hypothetical protein MKQ70_36965 [Chitinophaga sedimenti]|uniref:hypothetical protein n=1 Tax=Chitinophaga sedimenti TaxID=2033606 RepID=UPI002004CFE9|nr:hypothetical protein [Chitinophaga sedimenti]MCK7560204.1 hypothetical protein [Chitinophaga sedimenti]
MKTLLLLLLTIGWVGVLQAQTLEPGKQALPRFISASPDAAAIATYQHYPIDHVSGAPSIEIPLFDVPTRAGVLPFKLSYHIGSLKPSEKTSVAGWGWTLTPNIGVTRSVRGLSDGATSGYPVNTMIGNTSWTYRISLSQNAVDEQPDDFFFSLLSKSGRFIYDTSGKFVTLPHEAVKISRPNDNSFVVTDDDGTIYKFGRYTLGNTLATEWAGSYSTLTAWRVTEIIPFDKSDTVRFNYGPSIYYDIPYYNIQMKIIEYPDVTGLNYNFPTQIYATNYGHYTDQNILINAGDQVVYPETIRLAYDQFDYDFTPLISMPMI